MTLGLLPVSRANGLPLRVSNVVEPPGPFKVIVTFWMFQLSSVSKSELCDVRVMVTLPNADSGCAGPAMVNVLTWSELFPHPESLCAFKVNVCEPLPI